MHEKLRNGGMTEELCGIRALGGNGELVASLLRGLDEARRSRQGQQVKQLAWGIDVATMA